MSRDTGVGMKGDKEAMTRTPTGSIPSRRKRESENLSEAARGKN